MSNFTVGFTSTTFRHIKDLQQVVDVAKKAGAQYIEWGGDVHVKTLREAETARRLSDESNLAISSYACYYKVGSGDTQQWNKVCQIAHILGAKSIRVWLGVKGSKKTSEEEYQAIVADAKAMCDKAAEFGLIVSPECHPNTYNDNTDTFLRCTKDVDKSNFKTYFQSLYLDLDYDLDRMTRTIEHIENVHISYSERMRMQAFRKKDKMFIDKLMKKLIELDFSGIVLLEYTFFESRKFMIKDVARLKSYKLD